MRKVLLFLYHFFDKKVKAFFAILNLSIFKSYLFFLTKAKNVDVAIGKVNLVGLPVITAASNSILRVGDNVTFVSSRYFNPIGLNKRTNIRLLRNKSKLVIGNNTGLSGVTICCEKEITIGNNVGFGANCIIIDTDFHNFRAKEQKDFDDPALVPVEPVVIEDNVKIGMNVTILKGVSIGNGTIIAANSTVVKSCPPDSFLAGNPAKIIN